MPITWQAEDTTEPIADTTIEGIANFQNYSTVSGCAATYNGATMVVAIAAGSVLHNGSVVAVAGNNVTLVSDATNPRWTWIGISSVGVATIVSGTPAAAPTVPELGDYVCSQLVLVQANLTIATNATAKLDKRVIYTPTKTVLTTTGDTLYASAANVPARLAIGSASQVLTVTGGIPAWATASSAGADYQAFTGSGTWTKPAGAGASSWTLVRLWGAGGGGGGGMGDIAGTTRRGSGGGGSGGLTEAWFLTSLLSATETLTVGAGGTGGAGGVSAQGVTGVVGGNTSFGTRAFAYGGGGGGFGYSTDSLAGGGGGGSLSAGATPTTVLYNLAAGGAPTYYTSTSGTIPLAYSGLGSGGAWGSNDTATLNSNAEFGGGGGGSGGGGTNTASAGGSSRWGGGAGGGGGGVNSGGAERAGGAGGSSNAWTTGGGGAGGAVNGGAGTAGTTGVGTNYGGTGGGGGGGQDSGTGGAGAAGGAKGGGGGGGGSGTSTGGAGAAGGVGYAQIITFI